mmetsp:Transcript_49548/g.156831  ORF Transcript_49548/g.156831 Transcript_49548/m.156831 type:complete len:878 (+) Transcript_49548:217-2850(+)
MPADVRLVHAFVAQDGDRDAANHGGRRRLPLHRLPLRPHRRLPHRCRGRARAGRRAVAQDQVGSAAVPRDGVRVPRRLRRGPRTHPLLPLLPDGRRKRLHDRPLRLPLVRHGRDPLRLRRLVGHDGRDRRQRKDHRRVRRRPRQRRARLSQRRPQRRLLDGRRDGLRRRRPRPRGRLDRLRRPLLHLRRRRPGAGDAVPRRLWLWRLIDCALCARGGRDLHQGGGRRRGPGRQGRGGDRRGRPAQPGRHRGQRRRQRRRRGGHGLRPLRLVWRGELRRPPRRRLVADDRRRRLGRAHVPARALGRGHPRLHGHLLRRHRPDARPRREGHRVGPQDAAARLDAADDAVRLRARRDAAPRRDVRHVRRRLRRRRRLLLAAQGLLLRRLRPVGRLRHRLRHRVLHVLLVHASAGGRQRLPHRRRHQHHLRARARLQVRHRPRLRRRLHRLRRPLPRRLLRHLARRARHACHPRHLPVDRRVRPGLRQRGRHRRDVRAAPVRPREDGRARRRGQHHRRHRQGLRHRLRLPRRPRPLRRLCDAPLGRGRHHDRRPARPDHLRRPARRRDAALLVLGHDHEVGRHGRQRDGHRDQAPVRRQPEPAHPQPPRPARLRHVHQDLDRRVAAGDDRAGRPRHALARPLRRLLRHALRHRPARGRHRLRHPDGDLVVQHGRRVGQRQEVHRQGRPQRPDRARGARRRQRARRREAEEVADLQGGRHGRHGRRPAQGHVRPGAQHPDEADGHHLGRLRRALHGSQPGRRPHRPLRRRRAQGCHRRRAPPHEHRRDARRRACRRRLGGRRPHHHLRRLCRRRAARHGRARRRPARCQALRVDDQVRLADRAPPRRSRRGHREYALPGRRPPGRLLSGTLQRRSLRGAPLP